MKYVFLALCMVAGLTLASSDATTLLNEGVSYAKQTEVLETLFPGYCATVNDIYQEASSSLTHEEREHLSLVIKRLYTVLAENLFPAGTKLEKPAGLEAQPIDSTLKSPQHKHLRKSIDTITKLTIQALFVCFHLNTIYFSDGIPHPRTHPNEYTIASLFPFIKRDILFIESKFKDAITKETGCYLALFHTLINAPLTQMRYSKIRSLATEIKNEIIKEAKRVTPQKEKKQRLAEMRTVLGQSITNIMLTINLLERHLPLFMPSNATPVELKERHYKKIALEQSAGCFALMIPFCIAARVFANVGSGGAAMGTLALGAAIAGLGYGITFGIKKAIYKKRLKKHSYIKTT